MSGDGIFLTWLPINLYLRIKLNFCEQYPYTIPSVMINYIFNFRALQSNSFPFSSAQILFKNLFVGLSV